MPGKRKRKRKQPHRIDCLGFSSRPEFVLHSSRKQPTLAISNIDDCRQLALLTEEKLEKAPPTVTLLKYLTPILPTELSKSLQTNLPQCPANIKTVPLYTSSNCLKPPSYCIGHLSIFSLADGVSLKDLVSRVRSLEMNICLNILLSACTLHYLELSCDECDSIYLPITTDTILFEKFGHFMKKERAYSSVKTMSLFRIQLVIKQDEKESVMRERGTPTHDEKMVGLKEMGASSLTENGIISAGDNGDSGCMSVEHGTSTHGDNAVEDIKEVLPLQLTNESSLTNEGARAIHEKIIARHSGMDGFEGEATELMLLDGDKKLSEQIEGCGQTDVRRSGCVEVEVWASGVVCEPSNPNALPLGGNSATLVKIIELFHPSLSTHMRFNNSRWAAVDHSLSIVSRIDQFYCDVKQKRKEMFGNNETSFDPSTIHGLTAELRGYQCKAIQWMLDRERGVEQGGRRPLHPLWRELTVPNVKPSTIYCNPHTGRLTSERYCSPLPPRGGILADEMGLGKTVEVLALLMAHRPSLTNNCDGEQEVMEMKEVMTEPVSGVMESSFVRASLSPPSKTCEVLRPHTVNPETTTQQEDNSPCTDVQQVNYTTTTDIVTETSGEDSTGHEGTVEEDVVQCVCGANSETGDDGREYVQCDRCEVWQHSECAQFKSSQHPTFICIKCLLEKPLSSRTTLIISPQSILQQWREEIDKHTLPNTLSVLHYEGVKYTYMSPYDLAVYDVVLVSYETLALELNYAKSHEVSRVLRGRKRYSAAPSPLPAVNWWRVCLDEAQMVESAVTKPAEMCLKLHSVHRWCVTGTPIQRDLRDLYGLVLFLNMELYSETMWYRRLITESYMQRYHEPMINLFASIMWRNTKDDVAHELHLPEQSEKTHCLTFSLVEGYFYRKQQEMCRSEAKKVLSKLHDSHTLSSLTHDTVQKIMTPLHSLRRACCHPQMVRRGGYIPINNDKYMTMPQLLDKLTLKAKVESREELRKLVLSLNGLAGLYILQKQWQKACETYKQAISTWIEYKEKEVECDRLQRIHTLDNMVWLVEQGYCTSEEGEPLADIASIKEKADVLRGEFMSRAERQVRAAAVAVVACKKNIRENHQQQTLQLNHYKTPYTKEKGYAQYIGQKKQAVCQSTDSSGSTVNKSSVNKSKVASDQNKVFSEDIPGPSSELIRTSQHENISIDSDTVNEQDTQTQDNVVSNQDSSTLGHQDMDNRIHPSSSCDQEAMDIISADLPRDRGNGSGSSSTEELPEIVWNECDDEIATDLGSVWLNAIDNWAKGEGLGVMDQIVMTVNSDLIGAPLCKLGCITVPGGTVKELSTIRLLITLHIHSIERSRGENLKVLCELIPSPSDQDVLEAAQCHLSLREKEEEEERGGESSFKCSVCLAEGALVLYGRELFSDYSNSANSIGQEHGEGSRGVHTFEKIIRSLMAFLRQRHAPKVLLESGRAVVAYIDVIKKEYEALRILWQCLRQRVSECDELRLAACRMRHMTQHEILHGTSDISAVHPAYWTQKKQEFETERDIAMTTLTRSLGQVIYLNNLAKTTDWGNCPICTRIFSTELVEWGMLPCGHSVCMDCIVEMTQHRVQHYWQSGTTRLSCPLCRFSCLSSEINAVRPREGDNIMDVKGSPSTKILGVIRTLLSIKKESPSAKTLVFSSWLEILTLMSVALTENDIPHSYLKTSKTFQENLSEFKTSSSVNVLLLPLQSGSKGLNIVEATNVILMEPVLNISAELQAIGRVHRMGQTKPTTVHRFIIRDSVEEKIHHLLNSTNKSKFLAQKEGQSTLTLKELETLFN